MKYPPSDTATQVLDSQGIDRAVRRIAHEILEHNPDLSKIAVVGIPSRGVELAKRLVRFIEQIENTQVEFGLIDVSMHRDDLHTRASLSPIEVSKLPHDMEGRTIVLVDDVLFSGRTCRAAMDALLDFGRPARIQYAVLIDRGHRELPIRADYVGKNLPTAPGQRVYVRFEAVDGVPDSVWMDR